MLYSNFLHILSNVLYELDNLTVEQYSKIEELQEILQNLDTANYTVNEEQQNAITLIAKESLLKNTEIDTKKIKEILEAKEPKLDSIPSNSLLACLYYMNDIVAASTAMGRGNEESIVPEEKHNLALYEFFSYLETAEPSLAAISKSFPLNKPATDLIPLVLNLCEISYASHQGWKCQNKAKKLKHVDTFFKTQAEECMAKGSMRILESLQKLPLNAQKTLISTSYNSLQVLNLQNCSNDAIKTLKSEVTTRRYRSGNSGKAWLEMRASIKITDTKPHNQPSENAAQESSELKDKACSRL